MAHTDRFRKAFTVLLDAETDTMLQQLTENGRIKGAQVIRDAIRVTFTMKRGGRPTCADGTNCRCPTMHTYQPPQPVQPLPVAGTQGGL